MIRYEEGEARDKMYNMYKISIAGELDGFAA